VIVALNWLHGLLKGRPAPANPWGGNTLEWRTASPPPHDNFPTSVTVGDPYEMHHWHDRGPEQGWVLVPAEKKPGSPVA
jgi:cytochrome c oxidase subunit 1